MQDQWDGMPNKSGFSSKKLQWIIATIVEVYACSSKKFGKILQVIFG